MPIIHGEQATRTARNHGWRTLRPGIVLAFLAGGVIGACGIIAAALAEYARIIQDQ